MVIGVVMVDNSHSRSEVLVHGILVTDVMDSSALNSLLARNLIPICIPKILGFSLFSNRYKIVHFVVAVDW